MATKKGGKEATAEKKEKKVKKVHEPGQRPNSKQVDAFDIPNGKVVSFAYSIRKTGSLVTSVVYDKDGNPVGISSQLVLGTKTKSKKGHGTLNPGVTGEGKKKSSDEEGDDSAPETKAKKGKK